MSWHMLYNFLKKIKTEIFNISRDVFFDSGRESSIGLSESNLEQSGRQSAVHQKYSKNNSTFLSSSGSGFNFFVVQS